MSLARLKVETELIVIHNSINPATEICAICKLYDARYVHEPHLGLSVARNRGVVEARGNLVAFLDDDVVASPEWASRLVYWFLSPDVMAVTGRVRTVGAGAVDEWNSIYGNQPTTPTIYKGCGERDFLLAGRCGLGGNMAFRTNFLLEQGLFDPLFGLGSPLPGGDEVDRFYALLRHGGTIAYAPDVSVEHIYSGSLTALCSKIQGYATAQMGLFTKCALQDASVRSALLRHVAQRARTVLKRRAASGSTLEVCAPRPQIIHGSLAGPLTYLAAALREALWPVRTVLLRDMPRREGLLKVLMIFYNCGLGGAETIAHTLVVSLAGRLDTVSIVPSTGQTTEALHRHGARIGFVPRERIRATLNPVHHLKYLAKLPGTVAAYRRAIRAATPDLVHVDSIMNLPALFAARLVGVRTVLHVQEVASGILRRTLARAAGMLATRIVAVSEAAASPFRDWGTRKKISIVYNGTSISKRPAAYNAIGWITFCGRLSEDKDPITFIRAAAKVYSIEPEAKFLICGVTVPGRSRYEDELYQVLGKSGIPRQNFVIYRDRADTEDLLQQSAMVVNCSAVPEAFGLAVIEAMALGVPVIVPRYGAFLEIIAEGETGLLYTQGNIEELASCILRLVKDSLLAERIGLAGRSLVETRFGLEQMASKMEDQYKAAVQ
jgi:glycosyltransferase involved in cell wall biosynthesis